MYGHTITDTDTVGISHIRIRYAAYFCMYGSGQPYTTLVWCGVV